MKGSDDMKTTIVFGSPQAKTQIVIFGNLNCTPCAELHAALKWIRTEDCYIRYYISMLTSENIESAKVLIAYYMQYGEDDCLTFLGKWYQSVLNGKNGLPCNDLKLDTNNPKVWEEIDRHKKWAKSNDMLHTPAIFLNNRKLPMAYTYEDVIFLL